MVGQQRKLPQIYGIIIHQRILGKVDHFRSLKEPLTVVLFRIFLVQEDWDPKEPNRIFKIFVKDI